MLSYTYQDSNSDYPSRRKVRWPLDQPKGHLFSTGKNWPMFLRLLMNSIQLWVRFFAQIPNLSKIFTPNTQLGNISWPKYSLGKIFCPKYSIGNHFFAKKLNWARLFGHIWNKTREDTVRLERDKMRWKIEKEGCYWQQLFLASESCCVIE